MASFDVKSLFTYIPAQFTINLISDQIFVQNGKTFCCLPKNPVKKIIDLVMYTGAGLEPCFSPTTKNTNESMDLA